MTITASNIPGVSAAQLNQIVQVIGGIPGGPRGFMAAVETWVGVLNDLYGQESVPVLLSNESGVAMSKGNLVYVSGVDAVGNPSVTLSDCDSIGKPAQYVLIEDIAAAVGSTGQGAPVYELSGLDTSTMVVDDLLYMSSVAGGWTKTKPTGAGQTVQTVGVVVSVGTSGTVRFFPGMTLLEGVGTDAIQAGALAATTAGRAIVATDFFDVTTALSKFAANCIANAWLLQAIADGAFQDDAATRALFATKIWTADKLALARGYLLRGKNDTSGQAEAITGTAGQILQHDGTDMAFGDPADAGSYYTAVGLAAILQEIMSAAIGGTNTATRAYSSGTSQEPADNATLTAALASEMLTRRDEFAQLILDETSPPSATAGRGLVVSGGVVAPQGAPDLTVSVTALDAYNQTGKRVKPAQVLILSGFTIPAGGGEERRDIVVCDASGAIVRRVGPEGAPTQADATLTAGDVPLARVTLTQGVDTTIAAGNIADLRQTAKSIDPTKILAGILPGLITLAQGSTLAGNSAGVAAAVSIVALGTILAGDGTNAVAVNLLTAALGGTSFTARAYSSGTLQEPADDATLTAAMGSEMKTRRQVTGLLMDQTSPPTAAAGKGLVVSGCGVTPQGIADNTVAVASGVIYQQSGTRVTCTATPILAATTPNALGGDRYDLVVVPAGGGAPVIREGTIATTDPVLTAGDTPLARLTCAVGAFTIAAGQITDLRETSEWVDPDVLLPGLPSDHVAGSVAAPVGGATVTLTRGALNTLTPAAPGAYAVTNFAGLAAGEWADARINDAASPATITHGGNITAHRATNVVLAAVADRVRISYDGVSYSVSQPTLAAGQASGTGGSETIGTSFTAGLYGAWQIDSATQGGLVGAVGAATVQGDAFAVVYDEGTTTYALLSASSGMGGGGVYTSNYQCYPDAEAINDAVFFGSASKFACLLFDVSATVGVYANDSVVWEYSKGGGVWGTLTVTGPAGEGYDGTDTTAQNGLRPFQGDGCLTFEPPSDWASDTVNGQAGYWLRSRVTAAQITTPAIMTARHAVVISEEPIRVPHTGSLTAFVLENGNATLTAADVHLMLFDTTSGESRKVTWAAGRRRQRFDITDWALTSAARISAYVIQEAGANEPLGVLLEGRYEIATTNHTHNV